MKKAMWKFGVVLIFALVLDFGRTTIIGEEKFRVAQDGVKFNHVENHEALDVHEKIGSGSSVSKAEEPVTEKGSASMVGSVNSKNQIVNEEVVQKQKGNAGCEMVRVRNEISYSPLINRRWGIGFKGDCKKTRSRKSPKESRWKLFIQKKLTAMKMRLLNLLIRFAAWLGLPLAKFAKFTFKTLHKPR